MREWIDVNPGSWYYNEVIEATNYILEDGEYFIQGIPYNVFEEGSKRFFKEVTAGEGQKEFDLGETITVTASNPLYVYVDGTQVIYEGLKTSGGNIGNTGNIVVLFTGVRSGQIVSFAQGGIPRLVGGVGNLQGRPLVKGDPMYPCKPMNKGDTYYYSTDYMPYKEYCYAYGMQLKRVIIPEEHWRTVTTSDEFQQLLRKYIGYKRDVYVITPNNVNVFPYAAQLAEEAVKFGAPYTDKKIRSWVVLPYNLEGVTCRIEYVSRDLESGRFTVTRGNFRAESPSGVVLYNDRVFPNTYITQAEFLVLINRLRKSFIARFTDSVPEERLLNQNKEVVITRVNEYFISDKNQKMFVFLSGPTYSNEIDVFVDGIKLREDEIKWHGYVVEIDSERLKVGSRIRVSMYRDASTRFGDAVEGWYKWDLIELENEKMDNGEYLVPYSTIKPDDPVKRHEVVTILNRFRKWCLQRFKL